MLNRREEEIDKLIEHLEKQRADLMHEKHEIGFNRMVEKLNDRVHDAKKKGYKIKAIYISVAFYQSMQEHWSGIVGEIPMIEMETAKWQGYPLYNNWNLRLDEIHIAI